jgi:hypothetical protein
MAVWKKAAGSLKQMNQHALAKQRGQLLYSQVILRLLTKGIFPTCGPQWQYTHRYCCHMLNTCSISDGFGSQ